MQREKGYKVTYWRSGGIFRRIRKPELCALTLCFIVPVSVITTGSTGSGKNGGNVYKLKGDKQGENKTMQLLYSGETTLYLYANALSLIFFSHKYRKFACVFVNIY